MAELHIRLYLRTAVEADVADADADPRQCTIVCGMSTLLLRLMASNRALVAGSLEPVSAAATFPQHSWWGSWPNR